ncbi:MAG: hypothetical protein ACJ763_03925, partial [Bdellovibrionia bacterium]
MRNLLFAAVMALVSSPAHADGKSAIQIEDKIRVALKDIHTLEQATYAQHAAYKVTLTELNYALPSDLTGVVKTTIKNDKSGVLIQMTGTAAPILGRNYSIDASGSITGIAQYSANKEVNDEINLLIKTTDTALKAYYAEWETYTDDLKKLGVTVPEHLRRFGTLKVNL